MYEWKKAAGQPCGLISALKDIDLPRVADMWAIIMPCYACIDTIYNRISPAQDSNSDNASSSDDDSRLEVM